MKPSVTTPLQATLFSLFLFLLPFALLHFNNHLEKRQNEQQGQRESEERARRTLERMSRRASVQWWMERISRGLQTALLKRKEGFVGKNPSTGAIPELTCPPGIGLFPEAKWWVFSSTGQPDSPLEPLLARSEKTSSRSIRRVLESLLNWKNNQRQDEKGISKIVDFLFGPDFTLSMLAKLQGEPVRVLHENRYWYLLWETVQSKDRICAAYLILVPDSLRSQERVLRMAIRLEDSMSRRSSSQPVSYVAGFLAPCSDAAKSSPRHIIPKQLASDTAFQEWVRSWGQGREPPLSAPDAAPSLRVGASEVFWRLSPGASHHPFICLPIKARTGFQETATPAIVCAVLGSLLIILSGAGVIPTPSLSLRMRFAGLFGWIALLAFALLWIGGKTYLDEMTRSEENQRREQMRTALRNYDRIAESIHQKYQFVTQELKTSRGFIDLLSQRPVSEPAVFASVTSLLRRWNLPFAVMKLAHPDGVIQTVFSTTRHSRETEGFDGVYETGIRYILLEQLLKTTGLATAPFFLTDRDRAVKESAESTTGQNITLSFRRTLGNSLPFALGKTTLWRILDIFQDRHDSSWALLIAWKSLDLDRIIAEEAFSWWRKNVPDLRCALYRSTPNGLASIAGQGFAMTSLAKIAHQAETENSEVWHHQDRASTLDLCLPSLKNSGIWVAARSWTHDLRQARTSRVVRLLLLCSFGFFIVLLVTWIFARRLVSPFLELARILEDPEHPSLEAAIHSTRLDEVGSLFRAFGSMIDGLKARRRLAALVSGPSLKMVCEGLEALPAGGGKELEIVALVSDIRGFTTLCENHPPLAMTSLLNRHFDGMTNVVTVFGGSIDRFIGDAVHAVFVSPPEHALETVDQALQAGIAMLSEVDRINHERSQDNLFSYRVGIGLAWGKAWVAGLGDRSRRMEICFLGSTFETAARLESLSKQRPEFPLIFDAEIASMLNRLPTSTFQVQPKRLSSDDGWYFSEHVTPPAAPLLVEREPETQTANPPIALSTVADSLDQTRSWSPSFLLLLALMVVGVPLTIFWQGFVAADENDRWWRSQEAADRNSLFLRNLTGQNPRQNVVEANLERISQTTAELLAKGTPPSIPAALPLRLRTDLEAMGIHPKAIALVPGTKPLSIEDYKDLPSWIATSSDGSAWIPAFHLTRTLAELVSLYDQRNTIFLPYGHGSRSPLNPGESLDLFSYRRGKLIPTTLASTVCDLYWQPLLRISDFDELLVRVRKNPAWVEYVRTFAGFPPALKSSFLLGGIMIVLPPEESGRQSIGRTLSESCDHRTVGAVLQLSSSTNSLSVTSPGFSEFWSEYASFAGLPASITVLEGLGPILRLPPLFRDWSITWSFLRGTTTDIALLATRLRPEGMEAWLRSRVLKPAFVLLTLTLILLLLWSIKSEGVLGRSLHRQFLGGLGASVFLPLAGLFLLLNLLGSHWEKNLVQATRDGLQYRWQDFDLRVAQEIHALQPAIPGFWKKHGFENPAALSALAREFAQPPLYTTLGSMISLQPGSDPLRLDSQGIIASSIDPITMATAFHGQKVMERRYPHLAMNQDEAASKRLVTRELATEFILKHLETTFGPSGLALLLYGQEKTVELKVGQSSQLFLQYFVPASSNPTRFLSFSFNDYSRRNSAANALMGPSMLASGNEGLQQPRLIVLDRDCIGTPTIPEDGERFSFIRSLGRMTQAERKGFFSWVEDGSSRYFTEIMISESSPQHLGVWIIPESTIFAVCNRQRMILYSLAGLVFILLFFISWLASHSFARPIHQMIEGFKAIERGEFSYRLPETRSDELGQVMIAFNRMAKGLAERELLSRLVSTTAQHMSTNAEAERQAIEGTRRLATILYFSAGHDHTPAGNAMGPKSIERLNQWVTMICRIVTDAGGDIDKILGDKILAVFYHAAGGPTATADAGSAPKACRVALEACLQQSKAHLTETVHVGINTGEVICGLMGSRHRRDHTIIGDPVNLAARCCSVAEHSDHGPIVISGSTADAVAGEFICRPLAITAVKGKTEPVHLFQLIGEPPRRTA